MLKKLLFLVVLLSTFMMLGQNTWKKSSNDVKDNVVFVKSHLPSQYQLFHLDIESIKSKLQNVANNENVSIINSNTILNFPSENGKMQRYKMLEVSIMEDALAVQFPMIKTYVGQGIDDPTATLRMSIGTDGLHVMVLAAGKSAMLIDPYTKNRDKYILYSASDLPNLNEFTCEVKDEVARQTTTSTDFQFNATDGRIRQYRLAVACTIEYSAYHLNNQGIPNSATTATKKAAVLSAIVNTVNRVSGIYTKETSVKFVLVGNNSNIIFIDSDNFTNNNANALIGESQTQITNIIGSSNFDVGHTFSTGGGGLASIGSICFTNGKARGITGSGQPIGDFYDVDYVAHEFGHQFGANHTFNTTTSTNSCGAQRNTSTAGEPGGGTTIMAYAGICGGANVQANSDAYFHHFSLQEIYTRITSAPTCALQTNTGNNEPTANAGPNLIIPKGTAYILEGQSTDPDGDTITYCWEQVDIAHAPEPLTSNATVGPAYRSLFPTTSPNRFMPAFDTVFGGSLQSAWEVTPTVGRNLNFRLTTRDNRADGGQSNSDAKTVTVSNTAGPFAVTSHTAAEIWNTGENKTITWLVAGTTTNGVNAANVDILLVDDFGNVLSTLVSNTANDGSQMITVPNTIAATTRIMVKGSNHIFYAINSATISVNSQPQCTGLCTSLGNNTNNYDYVINSVDFNTIANDSPNTHTPYTDFTSISTDLVINTSYDLTISQYTIGATYPSRAVVWIDWNRDCIFNTTDEEFRFPNQINGVFPATISIQVPATASPGNMTMRISIRNSSTPTYNTSCQTGFIGEVEDYTVVVTSNAATSDIANFDEFQLSPNPNDGNFSIALKSNSTEDIHVKVYDIVGREIYNQSYTNKESVFNKEINLNNVESGIYLVNISDGIHFNTERIIIK